MMQCHSVEQHLQALPGYHEITRPLQIDRETKNKNMQHFPTVATGGQTNQWGVDVVLLLEVEYENF